MTRRRAWWKSRVKSVEDRGVRAREKVGTVVMILMIEVVVGVVKGALGIRRGFV